MGLELSFICNNGGIIGFRFNKSYGFVNFSVKKVFILLRELRDGEIGMGVSTNDFANLNFLLNKPLDTRGPQSAGEDTTTQAQEMVVPVGQPKSGATPLKPAHGQVASPLFQTGNNIGGADFSDRLGNVTVPPEIASTNTTFSLFGKKDDGKIEKPTMAQLENLKAQVDSGTPLDKKQMAELSAQFDAMLADQSPEAQTTGKAMSYMSSHAADFIDKSGNFKLPDDFKDQPKEVQEYILKTYNSVSGGKQTEN